MFNSDLDNTSNSNDCYNIITNDSIVPPAGTFAPAGTYPIFLEITTNHYSINSGQYCKNDTIKYVEIVNRPEYTRNYQLSTEPDLPCGEDIELIFNSTHNNVSSFEYEFADYCPPISGLPITTEDFNVTLGAAFNYRLNIYLENLHTDTFKCILKDSIYITTFPFPNANFDYNNLFCENEEICFSDLSTITDTVITYLNSLQLDNNSNNDSLYIKYWQWDFDNGETNSISPNPCILYDAQGGNPTTYNPKLIVTTNQGCVDSFDIYVPISPSPITDIDTVFKTGVNEGQFVFDGTTSQTSDGSDLSYDDYNFTWWINYPGFDGGSAIEIFTPDSIIWQFSQGNDLYWIYLEIENEFGCKSRDSIQQFVDYFKGLYIPNALAPNGNNGEPSYFLPKGISLEEYHLEIYDIWGNLIWQTKEISNPVGRPSQPWRGTTIDGKLLPQGTYVWKIYAQFKDDSVWPGIDGKITGPIYLIR